jgi:transposase
MPQQRMDIRMIKDILRLKYSAALPHEAIARSLGISKGVVAKYLSLAGAASLDWVTVANLDEAGLERRLLGRTVAQTQVVEADFARVHIELRRKGVTLMLLWQEYRAAHEGRRTWAYTQFCEHYKAFAKTLKRSMRQQRRAGEKLFIDYAGPTLALADGSRAQIFVAAMGASSYTFACATADQSMRSWLGAMARALSFYGGVPQLIVPDNPRALVADACRHEPKLNETVRDFARHYDVSILPARPFLPKDKATAESAVQVVTRWILARLRHTVLADVHAADAAISALLASLNNRPFQKLDGSRASLFATLDSPALTPLPAQAWQWATFKTVKAHIDYHVEVEFHRYSVPHSLVGLELEARVTDALVEVLHRGQRVACHARQQPPRRLHHAGRAHACSAPRAQAVDTRAADPLGCGHRPEHGPVRRAVAAKVPPPRARLPQLPGPAQPGQALRSGAAGGGLHAGAGVARRALPPRARHPGQRARSDRAQRARARVGSPCARQRARRGQLPLMRPSPTPPNPSNSRIRT